MSILALPVALPGRAYHLQGRAPLAHSEWFVGGGDPLAQRPLFGRRFLALRLGEGREL